MNLREAAQQALEALQIWQDSLTNPSAMPEWRFAVVGEKAIAALRAALAEDRSADSGKTYDDTDDTPEQKMLRKKWFGGRLYGHLPFLEAVDETMKRLYDKLDEAQGTWKMLDNHFPDAGKMVATIRPEVTVEPVAWIGRLEGGIEYGPYHKAALKLPDGVRFYLYTAPPKRKPLTEQQYEALVEDLSEWSRYVEVDTAHQTLEKHIREVLTAHGVKGEA